MQAYNSAFNFANRNASQPVDVAALAVSFAVATTAAVGAAAGLGRVVSRLQSRGGAGAGGGALPLPALLLARALPWLAVAVSGSANVLAMRHSEALTGIEVFDERGAAAGTSVAAGRAALAQVVLTRVALPVPILLLPPFVLDAARAAPGLGAVMARSAGARAAVELAVLAAFLQGALPMAIALFPQTGAIAAKDLEPRFAEKYGRDAVFTYNKGL